jgi:hypothetical protein
MSCFQLSIKIYNNQPLVTVSLPVLAQRPHQGWDTVPSVLWPQ